MPGRSFTKQEQRLFYVNLVTAAIALAISVLWKRSIENSMPISTYFALSIVIIHSAVNALIGFGFVGMFAVLLAAQFSQCWTAIVGMESLRITRST